MDLIGPSRPSDFAAVTELLARCGLPNADVGAHLEHFNVARDDDRVVGVIGLEVHGTRGLLRSLVVAEDRRGRGMTRRLYAAALVTASRIGLSELYCMSTMEGYFELLGWWALAPDEVPPEIRGSEEYRALASVATCMMRRMPRE